VKKGNHILFGGGHHHRGSPGKKQRCWGREGAGKAGAEEGVQLKQEWEDN